MHSKEPEHAPKPKRPTLTLPRKPQHDRASQSGTLTVFAGDAQADESVRSSTGRPADGSAPEDRAVGPAASP